MDEILYQVAELEVRKRGKQYLLRYDVGSIATVMREDEISIEEAQHASTGVKQALSVIDAVMERVRARGEDPHKSNLGDW
jgi:L-serine deaminase